MPDHISSHPDHRRTSKPLTTVLIIIGGVIVAACGGGSPGEPAAGSTTGESVATESVEPPVTESVEPSVTESVEPPVIATVEPDGSTVATVVDTSASTSPEPVSEVTVAWDGNGRELPVEVLGSTVLPSSVGELRISVVRPVERIESVSGFAVTPQGFVAVSDGQLLASADAVRWRVVGSPFPGLLMSLDPAGPERFTATVLTDSGVEQRWSSADLEQWTLEGESSGADAFIEGLDGPGLVSSRIRQSMVLPNGSTLASVLTGIDIQGQLVARLGDAESRRWFAARGSEIWWEPGPGGEAGTLCAAVITTHSWGTCEEATARSEASVQVELTITGTPDAWAVDVVEPQTGASLGTIRGSGFGNTLAATLENLAYGSVGWFIVDGARAEPVQPDWANPDDRYSFASYTATADALFVYDSSGSPADGETDLWRTTDGRTWEYVSGDGRLQESSYSFTRIDVSPAGGLIATVYGFHGALTVLRSDDGVAWRPASRPPLPPAFPDPQTGIDPVVRVMANDRGFIALFQGAGELAIWTSPDGDTWEPVDVSAFVAGLDPASHPFGGDGGYGSTSAGNVSTMFWLSRGSPDTRWVMAVE